MTKNVVYCDCSWSDLDKFDWFDAEKLDRVTHLTISKRATFVDDRIGALSNLVVLNIDSRYIQWLPENIGWLTNLVSLRLDSRIVTIPESIGNLTNLKILRIDSPKLVSIPDSLFHLTELQSFIIRFR